MSDPATIRGFAAWHPTEGFGYSRHGIQVFTDVKSADETVIGRNKNSNDDGWRTVDVEIRKLGL